jgi:hypothetical protein
MRVDPLRQELQCLDRRAEHQARNVRHITAWILDVLDVLDVLDYVIWALAATKPYSPRFPLRVLMAFVRCRTGDHAPGITTALACAVTLLTATNRIVCFGDRFAISRLVLLPQASGAIRWTIWPSRASSHA